MESDAKAPKVRSPRKIRDQDAINAEVLVVARKYFAQRNFDQVRLEDIAEKAGTSVSDIMRNFNSKEGLFQRAIDQQFKLWDMVSADRPVLGEHLAKYVTATLQSEDQVAHILLFIKGCLNKDSKKVIRANIEAQFIEPYAKWLGGEDATARANLLTAIMFGISFFHYIPEVTGFQDEGQREEIRKILGPLLQQLVDGKP